MKTAAKNAKGNHKTCAAGTGKSRKISRDKMQGLALDQSLESMESKMSPKARKLYEKIKQIREAIGPVPFKTIDIIREIREK